MAALGYIAVGLGMYNTVMQGQSAAAEGKNIANQLRAQGVEESAIASQLAIQERRKGRYLQSRAQAVAAASGAGATDKTVLDIQGRIDQDSEYNALSALWTGASRKQNFDYAAQAAISQGKQTEKNANISAAAQAISFGASEWIRAHPPTAPVDPVAGIPKNKQGGSIDGFLDQFGSPTTVTTVSPPTTQVRGWSATKIPDMGGAGVRAPAADTSPLASMLDEAFGAGSDTGDIPQALLPKPESVMPGETTPSVEQTMNPSEQLGSYRMDFNFNERLSKMYKSGVPKEHVYADRSALDTKMSPLIQHHNAIVDSGKIVHNEDGSFSTLKTITIEVDGKTMVIPTVWDGKIVSDTQAIALAKSSGVQWPTFDTEAQAQAADLRLHQKYFGVPIHEGRETIKQILARERSKPHTFKPADIRPRLKEVADFFEGLSKKLTPQLPRVPSRSPSTGILGAESLFEKYGKGEK